MVGVFVAFIRVVYGRMIYKSLPIGEIAIVIAHVYLFEPRHEKKTALAI